MGIHDGHREKMRRRFLETGLEGFADHEALELLLYYAIPRRDTNPIAHALMERYDSLSGVLNAPVEDLEKVEGIGESAAILLSLVSRLSRKARIADASQETILNSSERAGAYLLERFAGETEASPVELFDGLGRDIQLLALAAWFCELTEAVCAEETACPEILSLLLNGLYALCYTEKEPQLVKAAFQFRLMALAGFEPLAEGCAVCGARDVRAPMLDIFGGYITCGGCKSPDSRMRLPLTEGGLAALRHVLGADGKRLYSFTLEKSALQTLDHAGEAFIAAQLERSFRTLDYYKSLLG